MPRPISWEDDRTKTYDKVSASDRTPYSRGDIERLFKLGPRAAQDLMQLMPRVEQANAAVVEREDLLAFLHGAIDAEDLRSYLAALRKNPPKPSRRKIRIFVPRDFKPARQKSLAQNHIWLNHCALEMQWTTRDDFFTKLVMLAEAGEDPNFESRFCQPEPPAPMSPRTPKQQAQAWDIAYCKADLRLRENVMAAVVSSGKGDKTLTRKLHAKAIDALQELRKLFADRDGDFEAEYGQIEATILSIYPHHPNPATPPGLPPTPAAADLPVAET